MTYVKIILFVFVFSALFFINSPSKTFATIPHAPHDLAHGVTCEGCHTDPLPDLDRSAICATCHNGVTAIDVATHSNAVIHGGQLGPYGDWTTACLDCHNPHFQFQLFHFPTHSEDIFLVSGTINPGGIIDNGDNTVIEYTLTEPTRAGWSDPIDWGSKTSAGRGLILITDKAHPTYTFEINSATSTTIMISEAVDPASPDYPFIENQEFGIMYGQLLKSAMVTPNSGNRSVKFFDPNGGYEDGNNNPLPGGFVDESNTQTPEGICQVCHTQTQHWSPAAPINDDHFSSRACSDCHFHAIGFSHGAGGAGGSNCESCHGHDPGYEYEPGKFSQGAGTFHSHSTHTELDSDDQIGPNIICTACHDINKFPYFKSGTDSDGDSRYDLAETNVCDVCHSEGGPFAGVTDPNFGAKNICDIGVYDANGLAAGKEKWCAGCHDSGTSLILGVSAPNIAGDSSQTWGYYLTGHTGYECKECHDKSLRHIDGEHRTYAYLGPVSESFVDQDYSVYQGGYRLLMIGGDYPLRIPKVQGWEAIDETTDFKLCFQCHISSSFFNDIPPFATNFNNSGPNQAYGKAYYEANSHRSHLYHQFPDFPDGLVFPGDDMWWDSDWDTLTGNPNRGGSDSVHSCVTCHNVHGSTYPVMMRDGKLSGRTTANGFDFDGLPFEYLAEDGAMPAVISGGVDLANSIGAVLRASSLRNDDTRVFDNTCWMACHQKKAAPVPAYTTMEEYAACGVCHAYDYYRDNYIGNYGIDYFRVPTTGQ